jgi:hypothetical protein
MRKGDLSVLASSQMVHGMLVVANMPNAGLKILRFSRMDPTSNFFFFFFFFLFFFKKKNACTGTHMLQLWTKSNQKETVSLETSCGVFVFDESMKVMDAKFPFFLFHGFCFDEMVFFFFFFLFCTEFADESRRACDGKVGVQSAERAA